MEVGLGLLRHRPLPGKTAGGDGGLLCGFNPGGHWPPDQVFQGIPYWFKGIDNGYPCPAQVEDKAQAKAMEFSPDTLNVQFAQLVFAKLSEANSDFFRIFGMTEDTMFFRKPQHSSCRDGVGTLLDQLDPGIGLSIFPVESLIGIGFQLMSQ